jgi:ABC-type transport system substrate-binding protein
MTDSVSDASGDLDAYIAKTGDAKTHGAQAGIESAYGVGRTPSYPLTTLTCDSIRPGKQNQNPNFLCDRRLDALIARALRLATTDPDAAVGAWARIENELVDMAPEVPLITPWSGDLVSKRVGNYQYNPAARVLDDQLWDR